MIELTPGGTDYVSRGTLVEGEFAARWDVLQVILATAEQKFTRLDVAQRWPGKPPEESSLSRWLDRAVDLGLLRKDGRGQKGHPYRYWLPEREAAWRRDPLAIIRMPELFAPPGVKMP